MNANNLSKSVIFPSGEKFTRDKFNGTPWPMGWVIAICGIGSLISMRLLIPEFKHVGGRCIPASHLP
ncbi:hypothetical protein [Geopsychrobacter electrodiphilus]|uniref:hypothetical protein n=1 Tax=Geopsychrobacter electrodiphilus TaxID=225196 RepID=UPI000368A721|nr:hypothetical protein [Geopsychrobacter electrodiphilus]